MDHMLLHCQASLPVSCAFSASPFWVQDQKDDHQRHAQNSQKIRGVRNLLLFNALSITPPCHLSTVEMLLFRLLQRVDMARGLLKQCASILPRNDWARLRGISQVQKFSGAQRKICTKEMPAQMCISIPGKCASAAPQKVARYVSPMRQQKEQCFECTWTLWWIN